MKLFYSKQKAGNFGDDLNAWLWARLAPDLLDSAPDVSFSGIGTVIGPRMTGPGPWIVFGSGVGYGPPPRGFGGEDWRVVCVRGPVTARVLRLKPELACTDPAILLSALPEFAPVADGERHGVVFVPHHSALERGAWAAVCERAGIEYLSPQTDSVEVVKRLRTARLVIADAMHAAIIADAMRTPWIAVRTSREISTLKWCDWTLSMGLRYAPVELPASTAREAVRSNALHLWGRDYACHDASLGGLEWHFWRDAWRKTRWWWSLRRRLGKNLYKVIDAIEGRWRKGEDEGRLDAAAKVLADLARRPGTLSDASVGARHTARLLRELRALEAQYADVRARA
ncbi:polysaccharide pyruvyl transferase family protein [Caulobacter sp. 17J80-11]|uniref:polysaccharide pyruvyl transferase family protein n=1 Tax=Caulobacter sp. 17J80-11 TaxID=2763502 RepID=UPI001653E4CF|nr:polysaccharide pyruvyl transferase family protein [Caulobacter sp. 17J80-11]MBC6981442.1 polysaccharide pyruvyl transferase family protein [Caulobacter sp. 17J80-11]